MKFNIKKVRSFFTKKRIIYGIIILVILIGGYFMFFNKKTVEETLTVQRGEFLQEVSASGNVVAKSDLNLSFQQAGIVQNVYVRTGDKVTAGQLLASQNTAELNAQLLQMQAGIALEQARLDQLLAGASHQDIQTVVNTVILAKQAISNAYADSASALNTAYNAIYSASTTVNSLQQLYFPTADQQGIAVQLSKNNISAALQDAKQYLAVAQNPGSSNDAKDNAITHVINDVKTTYTSLTIIRQQCEEDVYYSRVPAADKTSLDTLKTTINTALNSITLNQSTIASDKIALAQAQDNLALKQAPARTSDIAIYQAQIQQAKASAQNVIAQLQKHRIYSPIDGVVSIVNAKVGSIASGSDTAVSVISDNNFWIESYIPEINIALIKGGQDAKVTLDAYPDAPFEAMVAMIDPAQTIKDGVSTYKVTLEFVNLDGKIKSGMTGNIIVTTLQKSNVLSVPQGIVIVRDGQKFVPVKNGENTIEKKVETGSIASNGNIEITSGLADGDIVIVK